MKRYASMVLYTLLCTTHLTQTDYSKPLQYAFNIGKLATGIALNACAISFLYKTSAGLKSYCIIDQGWDGALANMSPDKKKKWNKIDKEKLLKELSNRTAKNFLGFFLCIPGTILTGESIWNIKKLAQN